MPPRKRLGQLLTELGVVDEHQLQSALGHQKQWGGKLGAILVEKGFCKEAQVVEVLAKHLEMPVVRLADLKVDPRAVKLVSRQVAEKLHVLAFELTGAGRSEVVTIAMSDPTDLSAVDQLAFHTGKRIKAVLCGDSEIVAAIQQNYPAEPAAAAKPGAASAAGAPAPAAPAAVRGEAGGRPLPPLGPPPVMQPIQAAQAPAAPTPPRPPPGAQALAPPLPPIARAADLSGETAEAPVLEALPDSALEMGQAVEADIPIDAELGEAPGGGEPAGQQQGEVAAEDVSWDAAPAGAEAEPSIDVDLADAAEPADAPLDSSRFGGAQDWSAEGQPAPAEGAAAADWGGGDSLAIDLPTDAILGAADVGEELAAGDGAAAPAAEPSPWEDPPAPAAGEAVAEESVPWEEAPAAEQSAAAAEAPLWDDAPAQGAEESATAAAAEPPLWEDAPAAAAGESAPAAEAPSWEDAPAAEASAGGDAPQWEETSGAESEPAQEAEPGLAAGAESEPVPEGEPDPALAAESGSEAEVEAAPAAEAAPHAPAPEAAEDDEAAQPRTGKLFGFLARSFSMAPPTAAAEAAASAGHDAAAGDAWSEAEPPAPAAPDEAAPEPGPEAGAAEAGSAEGAEPAAGDGGSLDPDVPAPSDSSLDEGSAAEAAPPEEGSGELFAEPAAPALPADEGEGQWGVGEPDPALETAAPEQEVSFEEPAPEGEAAAGQELELAEPAPEGEAVPAQDLELAEAPAEGEAAPEQELELAEPPPEEGQDDPSATPPGLEHYAVPGWVPPPPEPVAEGSGWLGQALADAPAPLSESEEELLRAAGVEPSDGMGAMRLLAGLLRELQRRGVVDVSEVAAHVHAARGAEVGAASGEPDPAADDPALHEPPSDGDHPA